MRKQERRQCGRRRMASSKRENEKPWKYFLSVVRVISEMMVGSTVPVQPERWKGPQTGGPVQQQ